MPSCKRKRYDDEVGFEHNGNNIDNEQHSYLHKEMGMAQTAQRQYDRLSRTNMSPDTLPSINPTDLLELSANALSSLPIPVMVLSQDGFIKFVNAEAKSTFQFLASSLESHKNLPHVSRVGLIHRFSNGEIVGWNKLSQTPEALPNDLILTATRGSQLLRESTYHVLTSTFNNGADLHFTLLLRATTVDTSLSSPPPKVDRDTLNVTNSDHNPPRSNPSMLAQLHNAVLDSTQTVVYLVSADGSTIFFNRAAKELLGPEAISMIGHDGARFHAAFAVYNDDFTLELPACERMGYRLLSTRENVPSTTLGIINNVTGDRMVINTSGECLYDSGEFIGGLYRIHRHMPAEAYVEQQRNDFLGSFETVCDQLPHIVWRVDPAGHATYLNSAWTEITGQPLSEALGSDGYGFRECIHPEDRRHLEEELTEISKRALAGKERESTAEVRLKRKSDGIWCWHLLRTRCLMRDGVILAWYGTYTEIHQNVITRNQHQKNWNQMTSILRQSAEVSLFAFDTEGHFTVVHGADEERVVGQLKSSQSADEDMIQLAASPELVEKVQKILDGHENSSVLDHEIGNRMYRTRLIADLSKEDSLTSYELKVRGVLGLSIDITDVQARAALELENATLQAEERSAQNNSKKKSEFLANMSHEMRTPLAGMIGLIDLLMDTPLDYEQKDYVSNIRFSCNMLLAIVNDVLDFSKVESGRLDIEKVPFNLHQMLRGLHQLLMPSIDRSGLDLIFNPPRSSNMLVIGDPSRIRQILLNLLTNAIKFTKEGSITLSVALETSPDCKNVGCTNCVCVKFEVKDTGCGMTSEVLAQLFQPFRQGDSSTARLYGGTGLGLTISQNLAALMHGHLQLTSAAGEGTTATFTVPLQMSKEKQLDLPESVRSQFNDTFGKQPTKSLIDVIAAQTASKMDPPPNHRHGHSSPASFPTLEAVVLPSTPITKTSSSSREKFHVLVVEDNKINQTIALKTIRKLGFTATAVWNGQEALDYLASCLNSNSISSSTDGATTYPPNLPSLILMDAQMPILDGYGATRKIRSESPWKDSRELQAIPIVALTASAIQGDLEKCMASGMNDYMTKPVAREFMEKMLVKWGGDRGSTLRHVMSNEET